MKGNEEITEILEAFDLTQCNQAAARFAGCDPKTVARFVAAHATQGTSPSVV